MCFGNLKRALEENSVARVPGRGEESLARQASEQKTGKEREARREGARWRVLPCD
jgi:hypothetical protein